MIYAVDFDGTLCENKYPDIGEPNFLLIDMLKHVQQAGDIIILWTMRSGSELQEAVDRLNEFGLIPDYVNDNCDEIKRVYGDNPRKVYADVYIDDHNSKIGWSYDLYKRYKDVHKEGVNE